jgi:hypothetical protein
MKSDTGAAGEAKANSGFFNCVCAYFRDFLDTDFRKQRMPKRSIGLRDSHENLTAIAISKYPTLVTDIGKALAAKSTPAKAFSLTVPREKYRTRINKVLLDVVEGHVLAIEQEALSSLGDRSKTAARELRKQFSDDPERYAEDVLTSIRNDLVRSTITPLLRALGSSFERQGQASASLRPFPNSSHSFSSG